jgi:hypothetical protein
MLFHKLTEIIGVDDVRFRSCSGERARLEPPEVNPFLYFVGAGVLCAREGKLGEPFPPCFAAYAEPVQQSEPSPRAVAGFSRPLLRASRRSDQEDVVARALSILDTRVYD